MGMRIIHDDGIMKAWDSQRSRQSLPGPCLREGPPPSGRPGGATVASRGTVRHRAVARAAYATNLLNAGAERVDIKALLGHESIATTQSYTHVGQERRAAVVSKR